MGRLASTMSHMAIRLVASKPTRTLDSNFTPSGVKGTWCTYSISISCLINISGGQTGTVELRSDSSATPTTVRATATNANSGTAVVGLAITNAATIQLSYLCPPGENIRLVSSGTATISIVSQAEVELS